MSVTILLKVIAVCMCMHVCVHSLYINTNDFVNASMLKLAEMHKTQLSLCFMHCVIEINTLAPPKLPPSHWKPLCGLAYETD